MATNQVYEWVTEKIIAKLEAGTVPWHCPWVSGGSPMNFVSKKPYRGLNVFMLAMSGYASPYWMSRKQIIAKGGMIRKGEKSTMVTFWKSGKRSVKAGEKAQSYFIFRYYNVWNVEQTVGIDYPKPEKVEHDPIEACESIIENYENCPPIKHEGSQAFYQFKSDSITMPPMHSFPELPAYYSTLFHEAAHSTAHESRLDRDLSGRYGSQSYSFEELVAEMTAAMLCGKSGIEMNTLDNSAAYIANWLKRLKDDPTMIVKAGSKAQKAADHITGYKYEASDKDTTQESDKTEAVNDKVATPVAA